MDVFCRRKEIVWSLFLFCSVANIYSTYKSVQDLPLTTLNLNRIEKASEPLIQEYQQQFIYCMKNGKKSYPSEFFFTTMFVILVVDPRTSRQKISFTTIIYHRFLHECTYSYRDYWRTFDYEIKYGERVAKIMNNDQCFYHNIFDSIRELFVKYNEQYVIMYIIILNSGRSRLKNKRLNVFLTSSSTYLL